MGMRTTLRAIIQCDCEEPNGRGCVFTECYTVDAESVSLETFMEDAREHFLERGWQMIGGFVCPHCYWERDCDDEEVD